MLVATPRRYAGKMVRLMVRYPLLRRAGVMALKPFPFLRQRLRQVALATHAIHVPAPVMSSEEAELSLSARAILAQLRAAMKKNV